MSRRNNALGGLCVAFVTAWTMIWPAQAQQTLLFIGRLVKHARYYWLLLAEGHLTRRLFAAMLQRIWALPVPTG